MIKLILRHKIMTVPLIIFVIVGGLIITPFSSPCACLPADYALALYIGKNNPSGLSAASVSSGFLNHFPKGTILNREKVFYLPDDVTAYISNRRSFICDYWIESNPVAKNGYRVTFTLDSEGKIIDIKAYQISSWFGIKFLDGHKTSNKAFNSDAV